MGFGNMQKMMKQVQKMQAKMAQVQEELGEINVEGSAGGGVVRVVSNCHQEIKEIKIDPAAVDPDDMSLLEDLVLAAVNDALKNARDRATAELEKVTGGVKIPGLF